VLSRQVIATRRACASEWEGAVQYYTVTEGRANRLDQLRLRDRSTYGLDWMVFYASSNPDAIRQWEQFKSGAHLRQAELEAEAAQYRAATHGYAPPWQAEREVVAAEAAERVRAEQSALRARVAALDAVRQDLEETATPTPAIRPPRRDATSSKKRRRTSTSAKPTKSGARKARVTATKRRRR
jgi:hypothetical protein